MRSIKISLKTPKAYLANPINLRLDNQWSRDALGQKASQKGIYIIFIEPERIIYVGKTRGATMDFATRLYRHVSKTASQNSRVYQKLIKVYKRGKSIKVALINIGSIREHFSTKDVNFDDAAMIDILEQVLIHYLKPEINWYENKGKGYKEKT